MQEKETELVVILLLLKKQKSFFFICLYVSIILGNYSGF